MPLLFIKCICNAHLYWHFKVWRWQDVVEMCNPYWLKINCICVNRMLGHIFVVQPPKLGLGHLIVEFLDDTQFNTHIHTVGLLWMSDQLMAQTATYTAPNKNTEMHIHALSGIWIYSPSDQAQPVGSTVIITFDNTVVCYCWY